MKWCKILPLMLLLCALLAAPTEAADRIREMADAQKEALGGSVLEEQLPENAKTLLPGASIDSTESLTDRLLALWNRAVDQLRAPFRQAISTGTGLVMVAVLCGIAGALWQHGCAQSFSAVEIAGCAAVCTLALGDVNSALREAEELLIQLQTYSHLLLPVLASAGMAAGNAASSSARYGISLLCTDGLISLLCKYVTPAVYILLALQICDLLTDSLHSIAGWLRGTIQWALKILLTGYTTLLALLGILGGTTDAVSLKALRLTLSGTLPVVGSLMADTADAVLSGAALFRSTAGVFGLLVLLATALVPFLKLGIQVLCFKAAAALAGMTGTGRIHGIMDAIGNALSLLLGLEGTCTLLCLISVFSFTATHTL